MARCPLRVMNGGRRHRKTRSPGRVTSWPNGYVTRSTVWPSSSSARIRWILAERGAPGLEERLRRDHEDAHEERIIVAFVVICTDWNDVSRYARAAQPAAARSPSPLSKPSSVSACWPCSFHASMSRACGASRARRRSGGWRRRCCSTSRWCSPARCDGACCFARSTSD